MESLAVLMESLADTEEKQRPVSFRPSISHVVKKTQLGTNLIRGDEEEKQHHPSNAHGKGSVQETAGSRGACTV